MQLAFARAGVSWHDAVIGTVHGRALKPALLSLLGRAKIGLFTTDGGSPAEVAGFFLERGLTDYNAWVCQGLGAEGESTVAAPIPEIVGRQFGDLNVLILVRECGSADRLWTTASSPSLLDDRAFSRPDSGAVLLTHEDVR